MHSSNVAHFTHFDLEGTSYKNLGFADAITGSYQNGYGCVIRTADCVPIALFDDEAELFAVVHAGWRGLVDNIIGETVNAMKNLGATKIEAVVAPHAGVCCYEFATQDMGKIEASLGRDFSSVTTQNLPSLNLFELASHYLEIANVVNMSQRPPCTICDTSYFSYRRDGTKARMALIALCTSRK